jgi:hypothetical protein
MAGGYIESIEAVIAFLKDLKQILCKEEFDIDVDFILVQGDNPNTTGYKNKMTLAAIGYDRKDIYDVLMSLTECDYCETLPDMQYPLGPPLWIFSKEVDSKDIYIKISISSQKDRRVFILSFHFAEHPVRKAYS